MAKVLREYQEQYVSSVRRHWQRGVQSVCIAAPPGAGKTEIAMDLAEKMLPHGKILWVTHKRDLAVQQLQRLRKHFGDDKVSAIIGGYTESPNAYIYVATIQSLLCRKTPLKGFICVFLDECHHYVADEWMHVLTMQAGGFPYVFGATATPEREDGTPLGDIFEKLVHKVNYSDLIQMGYLVRPRIVRPKHDLGRNWAAFPIEAWAQYGARPGIMWLPSVKLAEHMVAQARLRKVSAKAILGKTGVADRAEWIEGFERGDIRLLTNVSTIVEGMDFPKCQSGTLAISCRSRPLFLQTTGRLLRPDPGLPANKQKKILIDLTGATHKHGLPTEDRVYTLFPEAGEQAISGPRTTPEPEPIEDPEVVSVSLVDDFSDDDRPEPVELPDPDPAWASAYERREKQHRRNRARYGRRVADQM